MNVPVSPKILRAPRSFSILLLQILGLCPLVTIIMMLIAIIASGSTYTSKDVLYLSAILVPLALISFVMLYFSQEYIPRLTVDENKTIMKKVKKGQPIQTYDINSIDGLTSKRTMTIPGGKYELILRKSDGSSMVLVNEDTPYKGSRWERFAEKLSGAIDRPLNKEIWVEDYDGKLSLISRADLLISKKKGVLILAVPLGVSILGAANFRLLPTAKAFVLIGAITVLANLCISSYFVFWNRDLFGKWGEHNFVLIVGVFTLFIPYSIFYLFFAFALGGFKLPFGF